MLSPLLALALAAAVADRVPDGNSEPASAASRVEAFLLERPTAEGPEPVAVVILRRLEGEGRVLLEQDVTFRAGGVTILHDEVHEEDGWRFVRRELRGPRSLGRSISGEPDGDGGLRLLRWGASVPVHEVWPAPAPRLPLELLESWRSGRGPAERVALYDPLAEAVIPIDVRSVPGDPRANLEDARSQDASSRTVELRRADGSLAARHVLRGSDLVAFQWQEGERWARPIEPAEALRLAAKWRPDRDPMAAVWAAVRAGHVRRR